jgi:hypothetical protein
LLVPAWAITTAPSDFSHGTRIDPTPPAAACTSTVSPFSIRAQRSTRNSAVQPFSIAAAAASLLIPSGSFTSRSAAMVRCVA